MAVSAGAITALSVRSWYLTLNRPPGTPPDWVFGPVWSALYACMAVAAWRVWQKVDLAPGRAFRALRLWGWQLLLNALWTPAFFGLHSITGALAVIMLLVVAVAATVRALARVDRIAAVLMLPYLAWTGYAAYLTAGFWILNAA